MKEFFDAALFSTAASAIDLYGNMIREGIKYDIFDGKEVFKARVLTDPMKLDNKNASAFFSSDTIKLLAGMGSADGGQKFIFKGRIDELISPHVFLPDPCSEAYADDEEKVAQLISMHTTFIAPDSTAQFPVKIGDLVNVRLMDNIFSYNLQCGEYVGLVNESTAAQNNEKNQACQNLSDLFASTKFSFTSLGNISFFATSAEGAPLQSWSSSDGYVLITPKEGVIGTPTIENFINQFRRQIPATQIPEIIITSGHRSASAQAGALVTKRSVNGCNSAISSIPAASHPCYPIYKLYGNKTLIMEVLNVPNTKEAMTAVYERQMSQGNYSSGHMSGRGLDLRTTGMLDSTQRQLVMSAARSIGAKANYETDPPHIHIGIPKSFNPASATPSVTATSTAVPDPGVEPEDVG